MKWGARFAYHLCRLLLGGVFFYAGVVKVADPVALARQVGAYRILPVQGAILVAATLPFVETLAGGLLLANRKVRPAALVAGALSLVFMAALASLLLRGLQIDCGCFNTLGKGATPAVALLRDAGLLLLAAATYGLRGKMVGTAN